MVSVQRMGKEDLRAAPRKALAMCQVEIVHEIIVVLSFVPILQRYNRSRVMKVIR
jgi:hypothetical protein